MILIIISNGDTLISSGDTLKKVDSTAADMSFASKGIPKSQNVQLHTVQEKKENDFSERNGITSRIVFENRHTQR